MWLQSGGAAGRDARQGTPPDSSKGSLHDVGGLTPLSLQAGNPLDAFFPTLLDWAESRPVHRGMMPLGIVETQWRGGKEGEGRSKTPMSVMTSCMAAGRFCSSMP